MSKFNKGDKVRFMSANDGMVAWGGCDDPRKVLNTDDTYEVEDVEDVEEHSWHTKVKLAGVDGRFNSVSFRPADEARGEGEDPLFDNPKAKAMMDELRELIMIHGWPRGGANERIEVAIRYLVCKMARLEGMVAQTKTVGARAEILNNKNPSPPKGAKAAGNVYVVCAAIHFDDGKPHEHQPRNVNTGIVVAGRRHHNVYATLTALGVDHKALGHGTQGFLASDDTFVNRKSAAGLAFGAGQINEKTGELFSEDLY